MRKRNNETKGEVKEDQQGTCIHCYYWEVSKILLQWLCCCLVPFYWEVSKNASFDLVQLYFISGFQPSLVSGYVISIPCNCI